MAIAFARCEYVGLASGTSAVALGAYIRRGIEQLADGSTVDFTEYKSGAEQVLSTGIILPPGSPAWDASTLWNVGDRPNESTECSANGATECSHNGAIW